MSPNILCVFLLMSPLSGFGELESTSSGTHYDIGFLIDRSRHIGDANVRLIKSYIVELLDHFSINPGGDRVCVVSYAAFPKVDHRFKNSINRESAMRKLDMILYTGGDSKSSNGFQKMYKMFREEARPTAQKYLFIFTDGRTNPSFRPNAVLQHLRRIPVKSFIINVGENSLKSELIHLSMDLKAGAWYNLDSTEDKERVLEIMEVSKDKVYTKCTGNVYVRDECDRICRCVDGYMVDCYRVRKEFNEMTYEERLRYTNAFKVLSNTEQYRRRYEELIKIHHTVFFKGVHTKERFFPWHRWYLWEYENLLREHDCRITVPYWDWSYWSESPWENQKLWGSGPDGIGGDGNQNNSYCVETGPFVPGKWDLPTFYNITTMHNKLAFCFDVDTFNKPADSTKACLRRNFNSKPPKQFYIYKLLHLPNMNFTEFENQVRRKCHNKVHNAVGGDMCTVFASHDPVFFMHHGFLDKIWFLWQSSYDENLFFYFDKSNAWLTNNTHMLRDFVDSHNLPEEVRVTYSSFGQEKFKELLKVEPNDRTFCTGKRHGECRKLMFEDARRMTLSRYLSNFGFKANTEMLDHLDEYNLPKGYTEN